MKKNYDAIVSPFFPKESQPIMVYSVCKSQMESAQSSGLTTSTPLRVNFKTMLMRTLKRHAKQPVCYSNIYLQSQICSEARVLR